MYDKSSEEKDPSSFEPQQAAKKVSVPTPTEQQKKIMRQGQQKIWNMRQHRQYSIQDLAEQLNHQVIMEMDNIGTINFNPIQAKGAHCAPRQNHSISTYLQNSLKFGKLYVRSKIETRTCI